MLLLLPQRYEFSSKSQHDMRVSQVTGGCCCYRKGTNFQANHNPNTTFKIRRELLLLPQRYEFSSKSQQGYDSPSSLTVVVATAKVRIFKQITTYFYQFCLIVMLLLLPQRYEFSSKSQLL